MAPYSSNDQIWTTQSTRTVGPSVPVAHNAVTVAVSATDIVQQPSGPRTTAVVSDGTSFSKVKVFRLKVLLIIASAISYTAGIMGIISHPKFCIVAIGIWGGFMYLVAGYLSITVKQHTTYKRIIAGTGTVAVSVACSVAQLTISILGLIDCYTDSSDDNDCKYEFLPTIVHSLLITGALFVVIFGTWLLVIYGKILKYMKKMRLRQARPAPNGIPTPRPSPVQNAMPEQNANPIPTGFSLQYVAPVGNGDTPTLQLVAPLQNRMQLQELLQHVIQQLESQPVDPTSTT